MSQEAEGYLRVLEQRLGVDDTSPLREAQVITPLVGQAPRDLFNASAPQYTLQHEQPEHRIITFLKAQGLSNKEIAQRTGYTAVAVGYILKQPWARRQLLEEIESAGRDGVHELLKGAVADCVLTLINIQADEKAKNSDRVSASNSILDRFFGKPTQRVESINTNVATSLADVSKMQRDLAEVEAETQRVTGQSATTRSVGCDTVCAPSQN